MVKGILHNWLGVIELQESQKIDAEQFEKVFSALEEKIGIEQFQSMQEHLNGLQEKFTSLEEKVETFADMVGGQEQAILTYAIVSAVAAIAELVLLHSVSIRELSLIKRRKTTCLKICQAESLIM